MENMDEGLESSERESLDEVKRGWYCQNIREKGNWENRLTFLRSKKHS